jgi:glycyl-tRNA synthetase beta subunit
VLRLLLDMERLAGVAARPSVGQLLARARAAYGETLPAGAEDGWAALDAFVRERLESVLQQRGWTVQNVRAVVRTRALDDLRPVDAERNLRDLAGFSETPSFRKLAEAFKRVRNIARELPAGADTGDLRKALKEPAETALLDEIERREPVVARAASQGREFSAAYAEAAAFEPAVARFFAEVFVMTDEQALRQARLGLMKRLETLILRLGDISEIVAD